MTQAERFEGSRIYLRPFDELDVTDRYLAWFRDQQVTEFLESKNITREAAIAYYRTGKDAGIHYIYAICDRENDLHIGNCKIGPIDHKNRISDLVTLIGDTNYWGKGLATEAIQIGNKIAFEKYGIRKLHGGMYSDNIGSLKAYTKAGWVVEATFSGQYLLGGKVLDRICVSCFNPAFFDLIDGKYVAKAKS